MLLHCGKRRQSCHRASFTIYARVDQDYFEIEVVEHTQGAPQPILGFGTAGGGRKRGWPGASYRNSGSLMLTGFRVLWRF